MPIKTMSKKTKAQGEDVDLNIIATSVFLFEELRMKKELYWTMKVLLKCILPQSFREYTIRLSLNEEPYETRISDLERTIEKIESDAQDELFEGGNKKTQIKNCKDEIKEIEQELKEALEMTIPIEFEGSIEKLEYKGTDTMLVFYIPAEITNEINSVRAKLTAYKIELIRE